MDKNISIALIPITGKNRKHFNSIRSNKHQEQTIKFLFYKASKDQLNLHYIPELREKFSDKQSLINYRNVRISQSLSLPCLYELSDFIYGAGILSKNFLLKYPNIDVFLMNVLRYDLHINKRKFSNIEKNKIMYTMPSNICNMLTKDFIIQIEVNNCNFKVSIDLALTGKASSVEKFGELLKSINKEIIFGRFINTNRLLFLTSIKAATDVTTILKTHKIIENIIRSLSNYINKFQSFLNTSSNYLNQDNLENYSIIKSHVFNEKDYQSEIGLISLMKSSKSHIFFKNRFSIDKIVYRPDENKILYIIDGRASSYNSYLEIGYRDFDVYFEDLIDELQKIGLYFISQPTNFLLEHFRFSNEKPVFFYKVPLFKILKKFEVHNQLKELSQPNIAPDSIEEITGGLLANKVEKECDLTKKIPPETTHLLYHNKEECFETLEDAVQMSKNYLSIELINFHNEKLDLSAKKQLIIDKQAYHKKLTELNLEKQIIDRRVLLYKTNLSRDIVKYHLYKVDENHFSLLVSPRFLNPINFAFNSKQTEELIKNIKEILSILLRISIKVSSIQSFDLDSFYRGKNRTKLMIRDKNEVDDRFKANELRSGRITSKTLVFSFGVCVEVLAKLFLSQEKDWKMVESIKIPQSFYNENPWVKRLIDKCTATEVFKRVKIEEISDFIDCKA